MKKISFLKIFALLSLMLLGFTNTSFGQGIILPFQSDFSALGGNSDGSGGSSTAIPESLMPAGFLYEGSQRLYQGGQKIRFGASNEIGILPSDLIHPNGASNIKIIFDAFAWPQTSGSPKTAQMIITYGSQTEEITVAGKVGWPLEDSELIEYSCQFTAISTPTSLIFQTAAGTSTNEYRLFFANVRIIDAGASPQVATPTFSPIGGNFLTPQNVTISCATEGATIRYTTDGSNPTESSPIFTTPINVAVTTTIKAIAIKTGLDNSSIASATYTFPIDVPNIAAFKDANSSTNTTLYRITGDVTFVFRNGRNVYIKDATAGLLIYDNSPSTITHEYNNGEVISGGVSGTCTIYNGLYELIPAVNIAVGTPGAPVQPITLTMENLLANFASYESQLVKLENIIFDEGTFGSGSAANIIIHQNDEQMVCRNHYGTLLGYETDPTISFDVTGFAIPFNTDRQIAPRDLNDIVEHEDKPLLSGTVTITGSAVFGETLTAVADLTSTPEIPNIGALTYQWMRSGVIISTNNIATYTLGQADIDHKITVMVTAAFCDGNVISAATDIVIKAFQLPPGAPSLASKTDISITLVEIPGCEYRRDGGTWQTSTIFDGLTPKTTYSFEARKAETATHFASEPGATAQFTTNPEGVNENEFNKIYVYSFLNSVFINKDAFVEIKQVEIFDMRGRLVYQGTINSEKTVVTLHVPSGIYHVILILPNGEVTRTTKVLIMK